MRLLGTLRILLLCPSSAIGAGLFRDFGCQVSKPADC
jgi:hypothetical protein